ncbi:cupin domain-containing protein [Chitinophaga sancti]|uniref:Cupin domain-containing protein n=1 Tax=Chitinophaga sancti TaxID=1004 RepID=A0A1K1RDK7_9BACT|nr:cupin domain-containing protein [Chitinophaga sancti]WQD65650.1 cupin domain-containing protein [Chitinophaga sancti]WQG88728.1 cupin domain-containing protein [Chitinophaga sancti]SFW70025.1 Cupin domain-containing protein [Chitinophaga sancti]
MRIAFVDALRQLEDTGDAAVTLWENNTKRVVLLAPEDNYTQEPDSQNEMYIVMSGCAEVQYKDKIIDLDSGDYLFVPAGTWHKFINATKDFMLWKIIA